MAGISLVLDGGLESHFDRNRPRIGKKDVFQAPRGHGDQTLRKFDRWSVREPAEHHMRHPAHLVLDGGVEHGVAVAPNRGPPRGHGVDQLTPVSEPETDAGGGHNRDGGALGGERRVWVPNVVAVVALQPRPVIALVHPTTMPGPPSRRSRRGHAKPKPPQSPGGALERPFGRARPHGLGRTPGSWPHARWLGRTPGAGRTPVAGRMPVWPQPVAGLRAGSRGL